MKTNDQIKKILNFFSLNRDGKGVEKGEVLGPPNLKNFFKTYIRKFTKLLSVNLIMLGTRPSLALLFFHASYMLFDFHPIFSIVYTVTVSLIGIPVTVNTSELIAPVYGMYVASGTAGAEGVAGGSASLAQMLNVFGTTTDLPTYSTLYWVVIIALLVFTLVTWGWQNIGATYLTRNMVRGETVFVISDYFYAIKKNWKQGLFIGMLDAFIILVLTTNLCYFLSSPSISFLMDVIFIVNIGLFVLYLIMRKYIYLMMITFDITFRKMLKNALIFSTLGLKRNTMAVIGKMLIIIINGLLIFFLLPYNIAVPLVLPLVYYFGTSAYISAYAYYPVIEKYMITPYQSENDTDDTDSEEV